MHLKIDLSEHEIQRVADLSKIELSPEELFLFQTQLNVIADFGKKLEEVNVEGVSPLVSVLSPNSFVRPDVVADGNYVKQVLLNAPEKVGDFFTVPKVFE